MTLHAPTGCVRSVLGAREGAQWTRKGTFKLVSRKCCQYRRYKQSHCFVLQSDTLHPAIKISCRQTANHFNGLPASGNDRHPNPCSFRETVLTVRHQNFCSGIVKRQVPIFEREVLKSPCNITSNHLLHKFYLCAPHWHLIVLGIACSKSFIPPPKKKLIACNAFELIVSTACDDRRLQFHCKSSWNKLWLSACCSLFEEVTSWSLFCLPSRRTESNVLRGTV